MADVSHLRYVDRQFAAVAGRIMLRYCWLWSRASLAALGERIVKDAVVARSIEWFAYMPNERGRRNGDLSFIGTLLPRLGRLRIIELDLTLRELDAEGQRICSGFPQPRGLEQARLKGPYVSRQGLDDGPLPTIPAQWWLPLRAIAGSLASLRTLHLHSAVLSPSDVLVNWGDVAGNGAAALPKLSELSLVQCAEDDGRLVLALLRAAPGLRVLALNDGIALRMAQSHSFAHDLEAVFPTRLRSLSVLVHDSLIITDQGALDIIVARCTDLRYLGLGIVDRVSETVLAKVGGAVRGAFIGCGFTRGDWRKHAAVVASALGALEELAIGSGTGPKVDTEGLIVRESSEHDLTRADGGQGSRRARARHRFRDRLDGHAGLRRLTGYSSASLRSVSA